MKKLVILSLSIIGLTMMSFKENGENGKVDLVKVKNNNLAQSYVCCYFGFNEGCKPGVGFCDFKVLRGEIIDEKAVPVTLVKNEENTLTLTFEVAKLDNENEDIYRKLNIFELKENYVFNNAEVCEAIHVNVGTSIQAGSYKITREKGNMSITFNIK